MSAQRRLLEIVLRKLDDTQRDIEAILKDPSELQARIAQLEAANKRLAGEVVLLQNQLSAKTRGKRRG